jgi:hypothetical protein
MGSFYKLYNCFNDEVIYTDTTNCPLCSAYVPNKLMPTTLDPISCWYVTRVTTVVYPLIPVVTDIEQPCTPCVTKCYTITGIGNVTYIDHFGQLIEDTVPTRICSKSYPDAVGTDINITMGDPCVQVPNDKLYECQDVCYELINCVTREIIQSNSQELAFSYSLGEIVTLAEFPGCWQIGTAVVCLTPIPVTVLTTFTDCIACLPIINYRLESCDPADDFVLYTSEDLSVYVDRIVTLDEYEGCFYVSIYIGAVPSPVVVTVSIAYDTCQECAVTRYAVIDCAGIAPTVYTTTNLSAYLTSIIKLKFCPESCYYVEETDVNTSDDLVIVEAVYESCEVCLTNTVCFCSVITNNSDATAVFLFEDCDNVIKSITLAAGKNSVKFCVLRWIYPEGWDLPEIYTDNGPCVDNGCPSDVPFKSVRPGYNSPACSTEYYERIACSYSQVLYKDVIAQRYGIAPCCPEDDLYRLDIKFQLLELQAILNPDYVCRPFQDCCTHNTGCGCGCNTPSTNSCHQTINCGCGCNS